MRQKLLDLWMKSGILHKNGSFGDKISKQKMVFLKLVNLLFSIKNLKTRGLSDTEHNFNSSQLAKMKKSIPPMSLP